MSDQTQEGTQEAPKKVQIKKSVLAAQIEAGMKKTELMAHYGLKEAQMTKVLQAAGLKIRKFHMPVFELEDDMEEEVAEEEQVQEVQQVADEVAEGEVQAETTQDIASNVEEVQVEEVEEIQAETAEQASNTWK